MTLGLNKALIQPNGSPKCRNKPSASSAWQPHRGHGARRGSLNSWRILLTLHERKQEKKAWTASSRSFFNIPKSSLSPKGTKKAQSFPKSQGCSKALVWACTQALQGSVPGLGQPLLSTPLFPLPETQHFQGLSSSMAPFYTRVWLLSALLSVIVSWVIKQSFLTESWRSFCPTSPPSLHPNTAFLLAVAHVSFPLLLF